MTNWGDYFISSQTKSYNKFYENYRDLSPLIQFDFVEFRSIVVCLQEFRSIVEFRRIVVCDTSPPSPSKGGIKENGKYLR